jgi:hypothetical protein
MSARHWTCLWLSLVACAGPAHALGSLFDASPPTESVYLNSAEYNQLKINAGWAHDDPQTMVFEVKNPLPGAVFCPAVQVTDKKDKTSSRELRPKLYLPTGSMRRASAGSVEKEKIKSYVLVCTCNKAVNGPAVCTGQ